MAVRVRLTRIGKKDQPFYRVVAIDSKKSRDGGPLEILGTYNPAMDRVERLSTDRLQYWISQGALCSDSVKRIMKIHKKNSGQPSLS